MCRMHSLTIKIFKFFPLHHSTQLHYNTHQHIYSNYLHFYYTAMLANWSLTVCYYIHVFMCMHVYTGMYVGKMQQYAYGILSVLYAMYLYLFAIDCTIADLLVGDQAQFIAWSTMAMISSNTCIKFQQKSINESMATGSMVVFIDPRYDLMWPKNVGVLATHFWPATFLMHILGISLLEHQTSAPAQQPGQSWIMVQIVCGPSVATCLPAHITSGQVGMKKF